MYSYNSHSSEKAERQAKSQNINGGFFMNLKILSLWIHVTHYFLESHIILVIFRVMSRSLNQV